MKPLVSGICTVSKEGIVGIDDDLFWRHPEDLKHFANVTRNSTVIMGRLTLKGIGFPLPGRVNIVVSSNSVTKLLDSKTISRQSDVTAPLLQVKNPVDALRVAESIGKQIFVIGGPSIWGELEDYIHAWNIGYLLFPTPLEVQNLPEQRIKMFPFDPTVEKMRKRFVCFEGHTLLDVDGSPLCQYKTFIRKTLA